MKKCMVWMVLAMAVLMMGCTTTSKRGSTGGVSQERYFMGTYSAVFVCSLQDMDKSIRDVCKRVKLIEVSRVNYLKSCLYKYKDINSIPVDIETEQINAEEVQIKITVDSTGDKEASQTLLIEFDNQLRNLGSNLGNQTL